MLACTHAVDSTSSCLPDCAQTQIVACEPILDPRALAGEQYVPLAKRAWTLWENLQRDTGIPCLHRTGCIDAGSVVPYTRAAADKHGLEYEAMTGAEAATRFPGYSFPPNDTVRLGMLRARASLDQRVRSTQAPTYSQLAVLGKSVSS